MTSETVSLGLVCTNCRRPYPEAGAPFRCPTCGGLFDYTALPALEAGWDRPGPEAPGLWRYRSTFGLPDSAPAVSLGEGNTPLVWAEAFGRQVAFKLEFTNPTGSFKDRGSAVLLSFLKSRQVAQAVEDSSGNAGASFAAYAARAGVEAQVYVPSYAGGPKRAQIEAYGAKVVSVPGPRSNTSDAILEAARAGAVYASHAFLPQCVAGYATLAYELFEQLGTAPSAVVVPAGQGNLLLAIGRGFKALLQAGLITRLPKLVGVQARACAPLWAVFHHGAAGLGWVTEGETLAEGVRIKRPMRGDTVLAMVSESGGTMMAVDEEEIHPGRDALARLGLYVELTSAITWPALEQTLAQLPPGPDGDPVAVVLTGSGLKSPVG